MQDFQTFWKEGQASPFQQGPGKTAQGPIALSDSLPLLQHPSYGLRTSHLFATEFLPLRHLHRLYFPRSTFPNLSISFAILVCAASSMTYLGSQSSLYSCKALAKEPDVGRGLKLARCW